MAVTRVAGSAGNAVKKYYDKKLIEWTEKNVRFYEFAEKRPWPKHTGDDIEWTMFRPIAETGIITTEGTAPTQSYLSADVITTTVRQLGAWLKIADIVDMTAITPIVGQALKKLRSQAARSVDKFIGHNLYVVTTSDYTQRSALVTVFQNAYKTSGIQAKIWSGNNVYGGFPLYWNRVRLSGMKAGIEALTFTGLTVHDIRDAVLQLRKRNIEPFAGGQYMGIAPPKAIEQLRSSKKWEAWHQYTSPDLMARGEVGAVEGVRFVTTTNYGRFALTGDTMTATVSGAILITMIFGKGAYGVTEIGGMEHHVSNTADSNDPLNQVSTVGWKMLMAAQILNKSAGILIGTSEGTS